MDNNNNGNGADHQPDTPAKAPGPRQRKQQRVQAADLQRFAFDAALSLRDACTDQQTGIVTMDVKTAVAVHKLIGAWDTAADRLRVLRGRGLPASVRAKTRQSDQVQPIEPA